MNLGSIYDKLDKIDKQIIMSSLSWITNFSSGRCPKHANYDMIVEIQKNKEYNKLIFLDLKTISYALTRELPWSTDPEDYDDTEIEYQISRNNPDKIKKLIKLVKKALK